MSRRLTAWVSMKGSLFWIEPNISATSLPSCAYTYEALGVMEHVFELLIWLRAFAHFVRQSFEVPSFTWFAIVGFLALVPKCSKCRHTNCHVFVQVKYVDHRLSAKLAIFVRTSCSLKLQICKATLILHGLVNYRTGIMASFGSIFWHATWILSNEQWNHPRTSHQSEQLLNPYI
jgi:hypothetical protein